MLIQSTRWKCNAMIALLFSTDHEGQNCSPEAALLASAHTIQLSGNETPPPTLWRSNNLFGWPFGDQIIFLCKDLHWAHAAKSKRMACWGSASVVRAINCWLNAASQQRSALLPCQRLYKLGSVFEVFSCPEANLRREGELPWQKKGEN